MEIHNIDNLAQFKRALAVGSKWESTYLLPPATGESLIRKVTVVQSNGVYLDSSFHQFGKAVEYDFLDDKVIAKFTDGTPYCEYKLLEGNYND
jgi:hypothetical protein